MAVWDADPEHDPGAPRVYRVLRTSKVGEVSGMVAADLGQKPNHVRLWVMVNRENKTTRPEQPLVQAQATIEDEYMRNCTKPAMFRLWAEVADPVETGGPVWRESQSQNPSNTHTLLFLKHFDVETQTLKGVGHLHFPKNEKISELVGPILRRMGWPSDTSLELYEVSMLTSSGEARLTPRRKSSRRWSSL